MIDITGLDKAEILAALYNNSRPLGLGYFVATTERMSKEHAQRLLDTADESKYFDYVQGRVMKVRLNTNELRTDLYDRDNGEGAAQRVIDGLRVKA